MRVTLMALPPRVALVTALRWKYSRLFTLYVPIRRRYGKNAMATGFTRCSSPV